MNQSIKTIKAGCSTLKLTEAPEGDEYINILWKLKDKIKSTEKSFEGIKMNKLDHRSIIASVI